MIGRCFGGNGQLLPWLDFIVSERVSVFIGLDLLTYGHPSETNPTLGVAVDMCG
jgi:hypothetical protein